MLNEGMFIEDWRARMGDSVALTTATVTEYLRRRDAESLRAQADAGPVAKTLPLEVLDVLRFYAHGHHFGLSDDTAWDTVSGEPQNFWCDEAGTATVEDGSIAKALLQGKAMEAEELCAPIDGEVYVAQEACNTHPSLPAAQGLSDLRNMLEEILDVYNDGQKPHEHRAYVDGAFRQTIEEARELLAGAATVAEPSYTDSTRHLHVGNSSFESWYADYAAKLTGNPKQTARDAYAAGMGDPLVVAREAAQQQAEPVGDERAEKAEADVSRLDSGAIMTDEFDDYFGHRKRERRGLNLRAMIDEAIEAGRKDAS